MARESSPPDKPGNRPAICPVVMHQAYGCVDVGDHSLKGQRMAPHTPSRFTALTPAKLASLIKRE